MFSQFSLVTDECMFPVHLLSLVEMFSQASLVKELGMGRHPSRVWRYCPGSGRLVDKSLTDVYLSLLLRLYYFNIFDIEKRPTVTILTSFTKNILFIHFYQVGKISSNHTNVPIWDLHIYVIHPSHMDFSSDSLIPQFISKEFMTSSHDIFRKWYYQNFT
ncbi:hypothetical protein GIB67_034205, partial [Kingdonia uniflora]